MNRNEYLERVKKEVAEKYPKSDLNCWEDSEWQEIINAMYDGFVDYTPEKQQALINMAGPEEPFWERVVGDGAYAFYMWA